MKLKKYYNFLTNRLMTIYIIYITILTLVGYSFCYIYVRNDFDKTQNQYVETISDRIDEIISSGLDISAMLSSQQEIADFNSSDHNTQYVSMLKASDLLRAAGTIGTTQSQIAVVNPKTLSVVGYNGSMKMDYFESTLGLEPGTIAKNIKNSELSEHTYIELMHSTKENGAYSQNYIITMVIPKQKFSPEVISLAIYDMKSLFKDIPNEHLPQIIKVTIDRNNTGFEYSTVSDKKLSFNLTENMSGYKKISTHTKNTQFWGNISVSCYIKTLSYYMYINNFFMFLILFLAAIAVLGKIYINSKAMQLYTPIRKMLVSLPKEVENSDNEFEAIGSYFTSLNSQKNAMSEIISENKIHLKDRFIHQLTASTLTKEQIKSELVTYGLEEVKFPGISCIICYKNFDELKNILTTDGLSEVRNTIKECFKQHFYNSEFFHIGEIDQETFNAIICTKNFDSLENILKKFVLNVEMLLDINMIVFMGTKADSWLDIPSSHAKALNLKNRNGIVSEQSMVVSPGFEDVSSVVYTTEQETEIINNVISGNINAVSACLEGLINSNLNNSYLPHEYYIQFVTMLYSTVIKILTKLNKTEKEVFAPMSVYLELVNHKSPTEFKATAINLFSILISNIQDAQESSTIDISGHILSYVDEHYNEDISLYTLAEYLNLSQSHASRTFKQITGENFKDYLTNLRLNKALEIMESEPYLKFNEVAKRVGYSSETFTRAFTKKYNITPSAYMQKKIKE